MKLLFQPAEENPARGEIGGARRMLDDGAFADPKPERVFGLLVVPFLRTGDISYTPGRAQASSDEFRIVVSGRQTHAAFPWRGVDPISACAEIVAAMQTIQNRQVDPGEPSVLSVATIHAGVRANIIPDQAVMTGTLRTMSEQRRAYMKQRLTALVTDIAEGMDAKASIEWLPNGYPEMVNDPALTERMLPTLARVAGNERVKLGAPIMATEDFSFFSNTVPGLFFRVGVSPARTRVGQRSAQSLAAVQS